MVARVWFFYVAFTTRNTGTSLVLTHSPFMLTLLLLLGFDRTQRNNLADLQHAIAVHAGFHDLILFLVEPPPGCIVGTQGTLDLSGYLSPA